VLSTVELKVGYYALTVLDCPFIRSIAVTMRHLAWNSGPRDVLTLKEATFTATDGRELCRGKVQESSRLLIVTFTRIYPKVEF
jgi:hypothetical protein